MNKMLFRLFLALVISISNHAVLAGSKSLCVFDLLGANGPNYAQMKDYRIAALAWGIDFQLKPYISERTAAADFESGSCDAVSFTGIQSRQFNPFTGTLDAMGALPSYDHLKTVINTISSEQAAPLMIKGPYEVAGVIPIGAAYLFVNDRSLLSSQLGKPEKLTDIRVAIMDNDPAQIELVSMIGTSTVGSSIAGMYRKFNASLADVAFGPAVVFEAMELQKGLQRNGGVIRFQIAQLTLQIMIRNAEFPNNFGEYSRKYTMSQFDKAVKLANNFEDRIAAKWWINISEQDQSQYHEMYRKTRISLRNKGVYDGKMLTLMRMVRCKKNPRRSECDAVDKE